MARSIKLEYERYGSKPEQKKNRAARNTARRRLIRSGVKKKDADKYILKPAKAAQKSRTKKNIKSLRRPAMSAAVTTVAASSLNPDRSRRRSGRGSNIRYLSEASRKKGRTQSRASQRGLTKKT